MPNMGSQELTSMTKNYFDMIAKPRLIYQGHSTDYQRLESLRAMVEDHFAILKVGPALRFALREAPFALA